MALSRSQKAQGLQPATVLPEAEDLVPPLLRARGAARDSSRGDKVSRRRAGPLSRMT